MKLILPPGELQTSSTDAVRAGSLRKIIENAPTRTVHVDTHRSGGEPITIDAADNELIQIELENGIKIWTSAGQASEDYGTPARSGEGLSLPSALPVGRTSRGALNFGIKALRFFGIDVERELGRQAALLLITQIEGDNTDLFRIEKPTQKPYDIVTGAEIAADRPILMLIHGTGSSTAGSFGALEQVIGKNTASAWGQLKDRYKDNTFALEHRSLSESPIDNALIAARRLPAGAELHLLTHSRGGLVGDLLARAGRQGVADGSAVPFDDDDVKIFEKWTPDHLDGISRRERDEIDAERKTEAAKLQELSRILAEKKIRVTRYARVACPAEGTTLASGRIDRYLSVALNVIEQIPFLKESDLYSITSGLLQALVETRTDPRVVPGLEAMMPGSPLLVMLNRPDVMLDNSLTVIAGDVEPGGFFHRLAVWASDQFYDGHHDFVVDTQSMLAGARRAGGVRYLFDQGPEVNHFAYFTNNKTLSQMLSALKGDHSGLDRFAEVSPLVARAEFKNRHTVESAPILVVLPGIMGTELEIPRDGDDPRKLWLDYLEVATGALAEIGELDGPVRTGGPLPGHYRDLIDHASRSHHVVPFGYDWRMHLTVAAAALAKEVTTYLDASPDQPIRFLAHSMGGLVVRTLIAKYPDVWERVKQRDGARFVMLGTPNGGSYAIVERMIGLSQIVRLVHMVDVYHSKRQLLAILRRLPGALDLLPRNGKWYTQAPWQRLHDVYPGDWEVPDADLLTACGEVGAMLDSSASLDPDRMFYVAGKADATPVAVQPDPDRWWWGPKVKVLATGRGDGLVPWDTGILDKNHTWFADTEHADLSRDAANFDGYVELLETGSTSLLSKSELAGARGAEAIDDVFVLEPNRDPILNPRLLDQLPMGGFTTRKLSQGKDPHARVTISHANLAFSKKVVAVGHYDGEGLVAAEGFINRKLGGALAERRALGLYPGALESSEVVFSGGETGGGFPGTLVIGLGKIGDLTKEELTRTLTHGFLDFAFRSRERRQADGSLNLATLLIGHSESQLTLQDSVECLLEGLVRCNRNLPAEDQIQSLEIIELYDNVAISAARTLQNLKRTRKFDGQLVIDPVLREGEGLRQSIDYASERDYYTRIEVIADGSESLKFTVFGDSAVASEQDKRINREAIDTVIRDMTTGTASAMSDSQFLFELMLPGDLKRSSRDRRNLLLILDEDSAQYPWELLDDAKSGFKEPLAVMSQITRQLRQHRNDVEAAEGRMSGALMVGDPVSHMVPLRGAQEEARNAAGVLEAGTNLHVTTMITPKGIDVLRALVGGENRVIHLAGHGEYLEEQHENGTRRLATNGLVLGESLRLDPALVACMRNAPEFVFLNCCHLGGIARPDLDEAARLNRHRLAANLAIAFLRRGARAVIAAGWEVDDSAAKAFSVAFYDALAGEGTNFGEAVQAGRHAAYEAAPGRNTWGAYQCYGDPEYRLVPGQASRQQQSSTRKFVARRQAIREIKNISEDALSESAFNLDRLKQRLTDALGRVHQDWSGDAELNTVIAKAASDIGDYDKAIRHYDIAIDQPRSLATIDAVEQRANLRARKAAQPVLNAPDGALDKAKAQRDVDRSVEDLSQLVAIGVAARSEVKAGQDLDKRAAGRKALVEQYRLLGSAYRRKAIVDDYKALRPMAENYAKALDASRNPADPSGWHADSAINVHFSVYILKQCIENEKYSAVERRKCTETVKAVSADLPPLQAIDQKCSASLSNFWDWAMLGDVRLCSALIRNSLAKDVDDVFSTYQSAWDRGGRQRYIQSITETLQFFMVILKRLHPASKGGELAHIPGTLDALSDLLTRLQSLSKD
ncbi:MAG: CHAT domain-containing protein [Pseudomonadota bacterium]